MSQESTLSKMYVPMSSYPYLRVFCYSSKLSVSHRQTTICFRAADWMQFSCIPELVFILNSQSLIKTLNPKKRKNIWITDMLNITTFLIYLLQTSEPIFNLIKNNSIFLGKSRNNIPIIKSIELNQNWIILYFKISFQTENGDIENINF